MTGPWVDKRAWPGTPADVSSARHFVSKSLGAHDLEGLERPVCLVASELCTNAVLHAQTPFTVSLESRNDLLLIEVIDGGSSRPESLAATVADNNGRGLLIIESLCTAWGVWLRRDGKSVWASFSLAPEDESGGGVYGW